VEQSWRIMQPILDVWESSPPGTLPDEAPFPNYTAGTWGPLEAQTLLARTGRHWHEVINREVLVRSPFFADAPPTLLNMLALSFQPLAVDPGTVVVRAGDVTGDLYVVCRGSLEAIDPSGRRLGTIDEGQCFGEMAVLQDRPRAATVRALAPCDLLVLPADDFRRVIADFPDAERRFREIAASRM
jgi:CRP-like cAMP-binding protein